jgi:hypothetical protein
MALKELSEIFANFATTFGFIAAGIWALFNLYIRRSISKKLSFDIRIERIPYNNNQSILTLYITLNNIGSRLLKIKTIDARIRQILPIYSHKETQKALSEECEIEWPAISCKVMSKIIKIEPSESDEVRFCFIIENNLISAQLYIFIDNKRFAQHRRMFRSLFRWYKPYNKKIKDEKFGWSKSYNINLPKEIKNESEKIYPTRGTKATATATRARTNKAAKQSLK